MWKSLKVFTKANGGIVSVARIIAAVLGDSLGHLNQVLAVAQEMAQHEFLFLGGGRVLDLRYQGYSVEEIPVPGTLYADNRVDIAGTVSNAMKILLESPKTFRRVRRIIKSHDPVLILTSYEFFAPLAALSMGRLCISIDNQHFLTKCRHDAPKQQMLSRVLFEVPLRLMYSFAAKYFVNTFFPIKPVDSTITEVFPPIVAPGVMEVNPSDGEHVLVYQTSPTFERLFTMLEQMPHRFVVYGFGERLPRKNLEFRAPSREQFVRDLASCRYVITNGGHTVISEALYFGKPVFSFPIQLAYEQFF
ncbi:MAG: hypothetical protein QG577_1248, partial [Thermodesulfobacteriota bacterium]|nr:hypothetical protein [Thermodesulfobacteriota bacterium]